MKSKQIKIFLEANLMFVKLINKKNLEIEDKIQSFLYKAIIDSFMYAIVAIRMDLVFGIKFVRQHMP